MISDMDEELRKLKNERDLLKAELKTKWDELADEQKLPRVRCLRLKSN